MGDGYERTMTTKEKRKREEQEMADGKTEPRPNCTNFAWSHKTYLTSNVMK